jgi:alkanesulfonate monooxygenase SsuD/methylene tetrahydromethanopterin reductase-like flavin-dependent oxidoreductase (luciferase family)
MSESGSLPFADRSISFRLYPHQLGPTEITDEMCRQAALAIDVGFDGIMVSEAHAGTVGNVPNPIQMTGWMAEAMAGGWVAPCPVLAFLRPPPLIVEEVAWLGARYPGRVGVGLGTGGHDREFSLYGLDNGDLARRFEPILEFVTAHLSGSADDELSKDFAVAACRGRPIPVLSAALSPEAARRAARCGAGIIGSSLITADRERRLSEVYRAAGGTGPEVLIRYVWLGDPPQSTIDAKFDDYRRSAANTGRQIVGADEIIHSRDATEIADRLLEAFNYTGKTCLHLRVHVPGISPEMARDQITAVGASVLPLLRREFANADIRHMGGVD